MPQFREEENERIIDIAVRYDDFMYEYDYYSYSDMDITRDENVEMVIDALKGGEIDFFQENLYEIREAIFMDYPDKLDVSALPDRQREMVELLDTLNKDLELWGNDHQRITRESSLIAPEDTALNLITQKDFTASDLSEEIRRREYNRNVAENRVEMVEENEILHEYSDHVLQRAIEIYNEMARTQEISELEKDTVEQGSDMPEPTANTNYSTSGSLPEHEADVDKSRGLPQNGDSPEPTSHGENAEQPKKGPMPLGRGKTSTQASTNEERINELRNMVREGVAAVRNEESYKAWLNTRAHNFTSKYSFNNMILVAMQRPGASTVMGFEKWKEYGRQVAKGSKGISIFAPVFYTEKENGNLCNDIMASLTSQLNTNPQKAATYNLPGTPMTFSMTGSSRAITVTLNGNSYQLQNRQVLNQFLKNNIMGISPRRFTVQNVFDVTDTIVPNFLQVKNGFTQDEVVRGMGEKEPIINSDGKVLAKAKFSKDPDAPRGYEWVEPAEIGKGTWELVTGTRNEPIITNPKRKNYEKPEYLIYNTEKRKARFNEELSMTVSEKDPAVMNRMFAALKALSETKGVPVFIVDRTDSQWKGGEANGYFMRTEGIEKTQYPKGYIVIPKDLLENEPTKACKTLIHEEAHADLHGTAGRLDKEMGEKVTRAMKETQAESVAFVVCKNYGIDTSDYSFKYLATWTNDAELQDFEKSLKVIDAEAKQLVDEINSQLEVRGLSRTLEELPLEPLSQDSLTMEARKYSRRAIEERTQIDSFGEIIPRQIENVKDNPDKLHIVMLQKKNLEDQHNEVDKQLALSVELEKTTGSREAQDMLIRKIESSFKRSSNLRLAFEDLNESLKTIDSRSKTGLRMQFEHNPLATLNKMAKTCEPLQKLSSMQLQYIAKSPYIRENLTPLLTSDPEHFAELSVSRAEEVLKVASKSGTYVEVVSCKATTDPPVFKGGELCHPKVADKIISEAETQIRKIKANSDFYPCTECKVAIFSLTEKQNVSCYVAALKLGDSTQSGLSDFMHKAAPDKKYLVDTLDQSIRERGAKDKIYVPSDSHGEIKQPEEAVRTEGTTMSEVMEQIGERRKKEQTGSRQGQPEHTDKAVDSNTQVRG